MKTTRIIILLCFVLVLFSSCSFVSHDDKTIDLSFSSEGNTNYNNYVKQNCFDYNEGNIAFWESGTFSNSLSVYTTENKLVELRGVGDRFMVFSDQMYYQKKNNYGNKRSASRRSFSSN